MNCNKKKSSNPPKILGSKKCSAGVGLLRGLRLRAELAHALRPGQGETAAQQRWGATQGGGGHELLGGDGEFQGSYG